MLTMMKIMKRTKIKEIKAKQVEKHQGKKDKTD